MPRTTSPQWTPDGSEIVFTELKNRRLSPRWLEDNIYVVASDGSRLRRIAQGGHWPSISPNGSRIAYGFVPSVEAIGIGIRTSKLDGSDRRTLAGPRLGPTDGPPSWSPDGERMAFSRLDRGVYTVAADLTDLRRVFRFDLSFENDPHEHKPRWGPVWSANGETLAFVVVEETLSELNENYGRRIRSRDILYTVGADGSEPTTLFATTPGFTVHSDGFYYRDRIVGSPSWSLDGRRLAFIRATTHPDYAALATDEERGFDPVTAVHIIEANGSGLRTVAEFGTHTFESSLSWSPSGTEILFTVGHGYGHLYIEDGSVYVVNVGSGTYRQIGKGPHASWSPDGSRIVMFNEPSSDYIFTTAPDGSDVRVLVRKDSGGDLKVVNR